MKACSNKLAKSGKDPDCEFLSHHNSHLGVAMTLPLTYQTPELDWFCKLHSSKTPTFTLFLNAFLWQKKDAEPYLFYRWRKQRIVYPLKQLIAFCYHERTPFGLLSSCENEGDPLPSRSPLAIAIFQPLVLTVPTRNERQDFEV